VRAAADVIAAIPAARFFIAGEGPERETLEAEIARLRIGGRFHLLGYRRDALSLVESADVYALPSLYEGLPRSVLEAMSLGKAVVVTDIGGSREVVRHRISGLVVAPANPRELAAALCELAADPQLRATYAAAGRRAIEQEFSAQRNARAHEAVYHRLRQHPRPVAGEAGMLTRV
jgi:glycosyltransferase involved in cell wall biosynthesis